MRTKLTIKRRRGLRLYKTRDFKRHIKRFSNSNNTGDHFYNRVPLFVDIKRLGV